MKVRKNDYLLIDRLEGVHGVQPGDQRGQEDGGGGGTSDISG